MKKPVRKTIAALTLAIALAIALAAPSFALPRVGGSARARAAEPDLFAYSNEYSASAFEDVNDGDWFSRYVVDACNYGFFRGKSGNSFDPAGTLTLGEAVKLAARLNSIYETGTADFTERDPYYAVYADYALSKGIIDEHGDYSAPIARSAFAVMIYKAAPLGALQELSSIGSYGVCDVVPGMEYYDAVYALYRAGILTGSDKYGTFNPRSGLTRAEACAIMVRLADPLSRSRSKPPDSIPAEEIFTRCSPAVFQLETFDSYGDSIRTGTAFFISPDGLAVTNLHVFENAQSANATLKTGDIYEVKGVQAYSDVLNLVVFSLEAGIADYDFLKLADSDLAVAGSTVYALGNPLALVNTITDGVVSNTYRESDGTVFFQFTAPISFGSGGSPVLNTLGQVVGVASSSYSYGQNLNLAVPSNLINALEYIDCMPLSALLDDEAVG
ncbi:MAG: trypsin-like peptidase domain-containing protein [Oscillospiraceae bacterium]|nr:trypsin-like peptidase domain-containing protein [Oscillospiraceae bacterium]